MHERSAGTGIWTGHASPSGLPSASAGLQVWQQKGTHGGQALLNQHRRVPADGQSSKWTRRRKDGRHQQAEDAPQQGAVGRPGVLGGSSRQARHVGSCVPVQAALLLRAPPRLRHIDSVRYGPCSCSLQPQMKARSDLVALLAPNAAGGKQELCYQRQGSAEVPTSRSEAKDMMAPAQSAPRGGRPGGLGGIQGQRAAPGGRQSRRSARPSSRPLSSRRNICASSMP